MCLILLSCHESSSDSRFETSEGFYTRISLYCMCWGWTYWVCKRSFMCKSVRTISAITISLLISLSPSRFNVPSLSTFNRLIQRILVKEETGGIGIAFLTDCFLGKRDMILLAWYRRREAMANLICSGVCVYDSRTYSLLYIQCMLNRHI